MTETADLVLQNTSVFTADDSRPWAEAMAVRGNRIAAVGKTADMQRLIGPATRVFDLGGKLVLPGFNDAHTHYFWAAIKDASTFSLYGVTTLEEAGERLKAFADRYPTLDWLHGARLDLGRFEGGKFPNRHMLDQFERQRPVAISDIDGHSRWVNSAALERIGYDANTADPVGGQIVREEDGFPNGLLFENAFEPIPQSVLPPGMDFRQVVLDAGEKLNRLGITSLTNNGIATEHLETLVQMANEGSLTFRVNEWLTLSSDLSEAKALRSRLQGNEMVRVVGLKTFIDGVLSSRTAWLLEDYSDAPGVTGFPMMDVGELEAMVLAADAAGFQVVTHAIGDRAVRETLDIYQRAQEQNGRRDSRHRIEHIEMCHPDDQARFAALGVIPCMQPLHCTAVIEDYLIDRIGEARSTYAYVWRKFTDEGAHLCFGTDWPAIDMAKPNPLENVYGAVTRTQPFWPGQISWHPEQSLSLEQALRCYTLDSAYGEFAENRKGSITPGKLADLCVIDRDLFSVSPQELLEAKVILTMMNGKVVYED